MSETEPKDAGVWKNIALFLAGCVLTLIGTLTTLAHDSIPRAEVDQKIHEVYQRMDEQYRGVNGHLESIDRTQIESGKELARIGEHLGVTRRTAPN